MTLTEAVVVVFAIAAATVAAILGHLTPELGLILGVALGYGAKGVIPELPINRKVEVPWKGTDE